MTWFLTHDHKTCNRAGSTFSFLERQILLHVLETLAIAAGDSDQNVVPEESYNFHYPKAGHRQKRSRSCPVSLHHRPSQHYDRSHYSSSGQYSRHLPQHLSHSHPFRSKHSAGNSSSGPKGLQSDIGLTGKQMVLTKAVKWVAHSEDILHLFILNTMNALGR